MFVPPAVVSSASQCSHESYRLPAADKRADGAASSNHRVANITDGVFEHYSADVADQNDHQLGGSVSASAGIDIARVSHSRGERVDQVSVWFYSCFGGPWRTLALVTFWSGMTERRLRQAGVQEWRAQ